MTKDELQNIICGKSENSNGKLIQTIALYLRGSTSTSNLVKGDKYFKEEETKKLIKYCEQNNFWATNKIDSNLFVSEGAEQKVYVNNNLTVFKLNDGIYYESWYDYFLNLLLHNYFFSDTEYVFRGFCQIEGIFYALVEQLFVKSSEPTDIDAVNEFMKANGFINTRNHDYFNPELNIILEDLHDENVLTQNGILYFIDTVFYIKP